MAVGFARLLWKKLFPIFLCIVEHEGDKLFERLFRSSSVGIRAGCRGAGTNRSAASEQCKKVLLKDDAEKQQNECAADTDVHAAELKAASTT